MSGLEDLIGAHVDSIEFGVAHLQLRLRRDDAVFSLGVNADVSFDPGRSNPTDFREAKAGTGLINLLEAELLEFVVLEPGRAALLRFSDGRDVKVWWPGDAIDNLFIVRRENSEEWWAVE